MYASLAKPKPAGRPPESIMRRVIFSFLDLGSCIQEEAEGMDAGEKEEIPGISPRVNYRELK